MPGESVTHVMWPGRGARVTMKGVPIPEDPASTPGPNGDETDTPRASRPAEGAAPPDRDDASATEHRSGGATAAPGQSGGSATTRAECNYLDDPSGHHPSSDAAPQGPTPKSESSASTSPAAAAATTASGTMASGAVAASPRTTAPTTAPTPASTPSSPGSGDSHGGHGHQAGPAVALAALGVVFGDIGTSPLYSLQTVFSIDHNAVAPTKSDVYGVISMVFWAITLVVSIKYVALVMRADNEGEGGILALTALLRRVMKGRRAMIAVTMLGIVGAGLFYGDSFITPAISVMSAIEGLEVVNPHAGELVLPVAAVILTVLFVIQRFGTSVVGRAFGPVMLLWFVTIAALGVPHIVAHPAIIASLSPTYAFAFLLDRPMVAFIAMGAVVLTITGAEALYADMGHFGAKPIRLAWFCVVLPCLLLCYLGQGALIVENPAAMDNPFFHLVPDPFVVPVVVLATLATVIASQAVISGAFSVSQQALHLGLLPRLTVRHTSKHAGGQIYVPVINWVLFVGVLVLVFGFRSSTALASAYGLAVTGTLMLTTVLFLGLADEVWHWPMWIVVVIMVVIGGVETVFFFANITKIVHGGWLPILIALTVIAIMTTWLWGAAIVREKRTEIEGPLEAWLDKVRAKGVTRVPGQAIYLHANLETVPLALKETLRFHHVLHERIAIITVTVANIPHVRHVDRVTVTDLGDPTDGIVGVTIKLGFNDSQDVPHNLKWSYDKNPEFEWDPAEARYFLSVLDIRPGEVRGLERLRQNLFVLLSRNAGSRVDSFHLPPNRTAVLGGRLAM